MAGGSEKPRAVAPASSSVLNDSIGSPVPNGARMIGAPNGTADIAKYRKYDGLGRCNRQASCNAMRVVCLVGRAPPQPKLLTLREVRCASQSSLCIGEGEI